MATIAAATQSASADESAHDSAHDGTCQVKGSHQIARAGWDYPDKNRHKIAKVRAIARCSGNRIVRRHIADARKAYRHDRAQAQAEAALTPYDCGSYGSFSIPCYVVECESGYDWNAYNPSSGAFSAYQFLPSTYAGVCETCDRSRPDLHLAASRVWARSGGSEWVCA